MRHLTADTNKQEVDALKRYFETLSTITNMSFERFNVHENRLSFALKKDNATWAVDYMDDVARDFCTCCAEDLREIMGNNVYFDIRMGQMTIILQSRAKERL